MTSRSTIRTAAQLTFLLLLVAVATERSPGQASDSLEWEWLIALPNGNAMATIDFFDAWTGIVAGDAGNILRTSDGGATWESLSTRQRWNWVQSARSGDSTLWLRADSNRLIVTHDRGRTWDTSAELSRTWIDHIQFNPSGRGYAVDTGRRLYRTDDGGRSWDAVADTALFQRLLTPRYYILDDSVWFAGNTYGSLFRTSDAGTHWRSVSSASANATSLISDITFLDDTIGFATRANREILRTTDRGVTWMVTNSHLLTGARSIEILDDDLVVVTATSYTFFSWDRGETWVTDTVKVWGKPLRAFTATDGRYWGTGHDGLIYTSTDTGHTWNPAVPDERFYINDLIFLDERRGFIGTHFDKRHGMSFGRTTDGGRTWEAHPRSSDWPIVNDLEVIGSHLWMTVIGGTIVHSSDLGASWTEQTFNVVDGDLHSIEFADSLNGFALAEKALLRTTDGGELWHIVFDEPSSTIEHRDLSVLSADTLWLATNRSTRLSTDGGRTWTEQAMPNAVDAIQFIDAQNGWMIRAGSGLLRTINGGASWYSTTGRASTFQAFHFHDTLHGVALIYSEIWTTEDGGKIWTRHQLHTGRVWQSAAFTNEHGIWVAALGGILHAERRIVTAVPSSRQQVTAPRVRPVPAIDHIVLEGLPEERGNWRVTIHSALGEAVRMIGSVPAEGTSLHVALDDLPAGVYVVRIENEITGSIRYARTVVQ